MTKTSASLALVTSLPETGFIRAASVVKLIPVSKSTLYRWCAAGTFPAPVKLSDNVTAWPVEDVRAWMAQRRISA